MQRNETDRDMPGYRPWCLKWFCLLPLTLAGCGATTIEPQERASSVLSTDGTAKFEDLDTALAAFRDGDACERWWLVAEMGTCDELIYLLVGNGYVGSTYFYDPDSGSRVSQQPFSDIADESPAPSDAFADCVARVMLEDLCR